MRPANLPAYPVAERGAAPATAQPARAAGKRSRDLVSSQLREAGRCFGHDLDGIAIIGLENSHILRAAVVMARRLP